jgi:hypothetical protein
MTPVAMDRRRKAWDSEGMEKRLVGKTALIPGAAKGTGSMEGPDFLTGRILNVREDTSK